MSNRADTYNKNFSKTQLGEMGKQVGSFAKIRTMGNKNTAITFDGDKVERSEFLYVEGYGIVTCIPYELHFIYIDPHSLDTPNRIKGRWGIMCTCGSMAGVISYNEVKGLMTIDGLKGKALGCLMHTQTKQDNHWGVHADGSHE
jgi:hypothetical protein